MSEEENKAIDRLYMKATLYSIEYTAYPNSIVSKKDLVTVLNLIEKQQKEIKELKRNNIELSEQKQIAENGMIIGNINIAEDSLTNYISKDKIKENFAKDIAFKKHLDRRGERIDQYNKGRFDVIEEILELLED